MKSSGSRAMKPITLSILLMLCACCAWADEVLELQPRLAEAAGAQGQAYVELRDRLVSTASTNALLAAVDDTRLEWRERLVARIVLERMLRGADIQALRNYDWPKELDRQLLDELMTCSFLADAANVILVGPNGLGKTMLVKNMLHQAILRGHTARFTLASDMLHDLAAQDSSTSLARRLRRYTNPTVLAIDEIGYLSYDTRYADLLFEVITRRYQAERSVVLTTNKPFGEWNQVFTHAACVVTLVDRLMHRAEIVELAGKSYRLKEATERATQKAKSRADTARKER